MRALNRYKVNGQSVLVANILVSESDDMVASTNEKVHLLGKARSPRLPDFFTTPTTAIFQSIRSVQRCTRTPMRRRGGNNGASRPIATTSHRPVRTSDVPKMFIRSRHSLLIDKTNLST